MTPQVTDPHLEQALQSSLLIIVEGPSLSPPPPPPSFLPPRGRMQMYCHFSAACCMFHVSSFARVPAASCMFHVSSLARTALHNQQGSRTNVVCGAGATKPGAHNRRGWLHERVDAAPQRCSQRPRVPTPGPVQPGQQVRVPGGAPKLHFRAA